jgi:hypothetical protein
MVTSRCCATAVAVATALALAGCGDAPTAPSTPSPTGSSSSVASPEGALAGFLAAASNQDNAQLPAWLATTTDTNDLAELLRVYSDFGSAGGVFWEVAGVHVTGVSGGGGSRASVTLSGDIVWCLGKAANDPAATCSAVTPVPGMPHTYAAVQMDGKWKADIDINASSGLDHNPQSSPTASAPTATPSPT